jgi:pentatricopeptide repeat protein
MFNSGIAQKLEDDESEERCLAKQSMEKPSPRLHHKDAGSCQSEHLYEKPPQQLFEDLNCESKLDDFNPLEVSEHPTYAVSEDNVLDHQADSPGVPTLYRYHGKTSPAKELHADTAKLYRSVFGEALDWKHAVDTVAKVEQVESPSSRAVVLHKDNRKDAVELLSVVTFLEALWDEKKSNQYIFRLYRELPHPGVSYLSKRSRGALLRRFANPRNRRWVDARRYLGIIDDMVAAELPVSRSLWSSAIHLAGRASGRVCKKDLVRSIGLWQQMEHVAGIKSDDVVFNILFDIAIKASQFTVADRLMEEMAKRDITFSRPGKVSKMYYYGMLENADGIRQTFDAFVSSGEIVDTVVLNCLVVSFLRAGETKTAEQLYHRMMQAQRTVDLDHEQKLHHGPGLSPEFIVYRKKSRKFNRLLQVSASLRDQLPEHHRALQEALPMTPDTRTFHILLSHHAYRSGNLQAFMSVIGDMEKTFAIPPRGMIYLLLFDGFAHNGRKRKGWTAERLRNAWQAYLRALHESKKRFNDRFYLRTAKLAWENPLGSSAAQLAAPALPRIPNGLYTPLPSENTDANDISEGHQKEQVGERDETNNDEVADHDETAGFDDDIDIDELFSFPSRDQQTDDELEVLERQIENGVFLGRRMIIIIIRAFGVCCGPKEVMEVWLQIERLWQPKRRKALDVMAVKEELEKQINKGTRRY